MKNILDPSKNLKQFTIFNKLPAELRLKIWCHCIPPPGRAVFNHRMRSTSSFHPDEDVVALPDNFFWGETPIIFQICQESRYIGKLRVFPITGLDIFHGGSGQFHPTMQISTQSHPPSFILKTLWFSPNDTIEIPIRDSYELQSVVDAARQIGRVWVREENPLKVRKVQFSLLLSKRNTINSGVVQRLIEICELVVELGQSATIFIGMGSGYSHNGSRFFLNDDQERWVYNEDGSYCNPELQQILGKPRQVFGNGWYSPKNISPLTITADPENNGMLYDVTTGISSGIIQADASQRAVSTYEEAYTYCLNSEINEEHIAKINPRIRYVDQIRATLVEDRFTGGWEKGEAWRRGLSFDKTGLFEKTHGNGVETNIPTAGDGTVLAA